MPYDYRRRVHCPLCESGEMVHIHPFLARCAKCEGTISYNFFKTLLQIEHLPEAEVERPCKCGRPETRGLKKERRRCPSCGS